MALKFGNLRQIAFGFGDPVILSLGLTQTIGYGTLYYVYGVVAPAVAREFGISLEVFFAAFTAGLLLSGLAAPFAGHALDRHGARIVMTLGSVAAAAALVLCALAPGIWAFSAAIVLAEIAACFVLYESAFAALEQIHRSEARSRITQITLIAGFASTIFWPLTQWLLTQQGWRMTFLIFAAANVLVCAPLHFFALRAIVIEGAKAAVDLVTEPAPLPGGDLRKAKVLYATAIVVSGLVFAAVPVHMLRIIENEGFTAEQAALIAMIMGPMQVMARVVEVVAGERITPLATGFISLGALLASLAVLLAGSASAFAAMAFAAAYGTAQGLITIARGTIPLHLFGADGYATFVGKVTGIRLVANAMSPFLFAAAMTRGGVDAALAVSALCAALGFCAMLALRRQPGAAEWS